MTCVVAPRTWRPRREVVEQSEPLPGPARRATGPAVISVWRRRHVAVDPRRQRARVVGGLAVCRGT